MNKLKNVAKLLKYKTNNHNFPGQYLKKSKYFYNCLALKNVPFYNFSTEATKDVNLTNKETNTAINIEFIKNKILKEIKKEQIINSDTFNINNPENHSQTNAIDKNDANKTDLLDISQEKNKGEIVLDRELLKQTTLKKLAEHIPLEKISDESLRDMIKYKVFEDSISPTVNKISTAVPEISQHDKFRNFINEVIQNDLQEELKNKEGIIILKKKTDHLIKYGIDYHHYRNFHDRDYEVDLKEVLEKDLFEKQRVVDHFVEENKEKINEILGFYDNRIKFTKFNKFTYLVYQNNYLGKINKIRFIFFKQICTTATLTALFSYFNPLLCLILVPEYFTIINTMVLLSKTIDQIILTENKQNVKIRVFNFLGFRREIPYSSYEITKMRYLRKFENNFLNFCDKGSLFVTRLLRRVFLDKNKRKNKNNSQQESKENVNLDDSKYDNFRHFHLFTANGDTYYIPADLSVQHEDTNEELLLDILNNKNKKVLNYDYSEYEDRSQKVYELIENWKKEYATKSHSTYLTQEEKLQIKYSKYRANRDFSDKIRDLTLKRTDGLDGNFVDNGYR